MANASISLTAKLAAHFRARPGVWLNGLDLALVGGAYAWRSRVSQLRTQHNMRIDNRQIRRSTPGGARFSVSEYRWQPPDEAAAVEAPSQGFRLEATR